MSFKQTDTITLNNYEEYFVLYMDNELNASQKAAVESFVAQHPQLAEELEAWMSTKLPFDNLPFAGKEELLSPAMKMNSVDESLLLYVDNELPPAEKAAVAQRIKADSGYALQHSLLRQTKLDAGEKVLHPDKKELYRHEKRTVPFGLWLRMAAAVVLLLTGTWFFVLNKDKEQHGAVVNRDQPVKKVPNTIKDKPTIVEQIVPKAASPNQETVLIKQPVTPALPKDGKVPVQKIQYKKSNDDASPNGNDVANNRRESIPPDATHLRTTPTIRFITINNPIAPPVVTIAPDSSYNRQNGPRNNPEVDWAVETKKKAPARGFFRKVSRFIERNTGIGTVSDDNELLVGAVALKLK